MEERMEQIEENFAYLREVLGVKFLPLELPMNIPPVSPPSAEVSHPLSLAQVLTDLGDCTRCKLSQTRKHIVFGTGPEQARLMFIGEGPGEVEDTEGQPFVGPAGLLLTKMIMAMGFSRDEVYLANIVKCRPPASREPEADESSTCLPFLKRQIAVVNPEVIVALGTFAAQTLLETSGLMSELRNTVHAYGQRKLIATFHPSSLLRNPAEKKDAWSDLQLAMRELNTN